MFKINVKDGSTYILDYENHEGAAEIINKLKNTEFQATITAVSIVEPCGRMTKCPECKRRANVLCVRCGEQDGSSCDMGVQYSLPRPKDCNKVFYLLEHSDANSKSKGYEKITCFADGIQIVAVAHKSQPSVCVNLHKKGKLRYNAFVG